jgi:hypothetical protein
MQALLQTLQDHDLGHLKIIAELWGLDLPTAPALDVAAWLASTMLVEEVVLDITESLPYPAYVALNDLRRHGGRAPLADVMRRFGAIREMGAGRRDRERPWRNPISGLEMLWYRGLIARAFADTPGGAQEFVFIPSDLLQLLPEPASSTQFIPGQPTSKPVHTQSAGTAIVDDTTTILSFLRRKPIRSTTIEASQQECLLPFLLQSHSLELIFSLLKEGGILSDPPIQPDPDATRNLLEAPREKVITQLLLTWRDSSRWNDLQHTPGISLSGRWPNDPLTNRQAVLGFLKRIPAGSWWDLESFVGAIREEHPGFQRPAGDFESWYLQDSETGTFLQGFEHWDAVEGALLRYMVCGPLYWLGAMDLGRSGPEGHFNSFRLTQRAQILYNADSKTGQAESETPITVSPDGRIIVPHSAAQSHRYQIARFCDWLSIESDGYQYRISPTALERATEQGLNLKQVEAILVKASAGPLHEILQHAMTRWGMRGREAHLERINVLRVEEQQVLEALQANRATARYLQEVLGATTAVVREKDWDALCSAAVRVGILIDRPPLEK